MPSPLIVVVELDGFQHGAEPFTPKCLAVTCDRLELSKQWVFNTGAFASRSIDHLFTFYHQATLVHGFFLTSPGVPQGLFGKVLLHTMEELLYDIFQTKSRLPIPDHVLVFLREFKSYNFFATRWTTLRRPRECSFVTWRTQTVPVWINCRQKCATDQSPP